MSRRTDKEKRNQERAKRAYIGRMTMPMDIIVWSDLSEEDKKRIIARKKERRERAKKLIREINARNKV